MDVFLMIRRRKLTIFTDCKDTTTISELKKIIEGILKIKPENMQLLTKDNQVMDDNETLHSFGLLSATAKAQSPAPIGLVVRTSSSQSFETLDITPYSTPPDLPDVMKTQESNGADTA